MPKPPDPLGRTPFIDWPRTPGPLGMNDAADPDTPDWFAGDSPTPLGIGDWADPGVEGAGRLLLAYAGQGAAASAPPPTPAEYVPDLGATQKTIEEYDRAFEGPKGALLKQRIQDAATKLDLNPGLIAASLLAEHKASSYTKQSGEVDGFVIGTDDWETAKRDMERRIPSANAIKPTRFDSAENEQGRVIPRVPFFKAEDAVLASATYLKFSETETTRDVTRNGREF